jgi:hypothetical protein
MKTDVAHLEERNVLTAGMYDCGFHHEGRINEWEGQI